MTPSPLFLKGVRLPERCGEGDGLGLSRCVIKPTCLHSPGLEPGRQGEWATRLHPALNTQPGLGEGRPAGQVVPACPSLPPLRASHTREGGTMGVPEVQGLRAELGSPTRQLWVLSFFTE